MIEKGGDYSFGNAAGRPGWVFCPEYDGVGVPGTLLPERDTRIFLFGSGLLPTLTLKVQNANLVRPVEEDPGNERTLHPCAVSGQGRATADYGRSDCGCHEHASRKAAALEEAERRTSGEIPSVYFGIDAEA